MPIEHKFLVSVVITVMLWGSQVYAQSPHEKVLYSKVYFEGNTLVVTQGPLIPVSTFDRLLPAEVTARTLGLGYFTLNIDVVSGGKPPLRVWSKLSRVNEDWQYDLGVLDLLVLPGRCVLVTTKGKDIVYVSQIELFGAADFSASLKPGYWSLLATFNPHNPQVKRQLSAKLKYDDRQKRVEVEVIDFIEDTKQHTIFEQKGSDWEFICVKQWQEKVPATDPASSNSKGPGFGPGLFSK